MDLKRARRIFAIVLALGGGPLAVSPAWVDPAHSHDAIPRDAQTVEARSVTLKLPDLDLLDQDGNRVKFKTDVLKDRLVAIDLIYTTCTVVCPILSAVFANVQNSLGDRLGKEVVLVSVSVDPVTDIPPRLKEYARRWGAKPGWVFLTGDKGKVDRVLQGLGAYAADFTAHPTTILVGDGAKDGWTRFFGFATPDQVLAKLDELKARRQGKARTGHESH